MTKKIVTKHNDSESTKCECGCGCDKGACTCGCNGTKGLIVVGTVLSLALSIAALSTSCSYAQSFDSKADAYIDANGEKIIASVEKYHQGLEESRRAQSLDAIIPKIVNDKTNYSLGNPNGKFVIIEFFDHQCGWCKKTNAALREALAKPEAKNIRWIPIDTPIFGPASETIARYVLAAGKQGKYAAMHEAVGNSKERLDEEKLIALGKKLGLDTKKLKADANGSEIKNKLQENDNYREALGIQGVPMLIVNGRVNPGALLGEALDKVIAESAQ